MSKCCDCLVIKIPELDTQIRPGMTVRLGRFSTTDWKVLYGWYAWGGNREVLGWYLVNSADEKILKPLQRPDLADIYVIKHG
jgi:hypothetical protein